MAKRPGGQLAARPLLFEWIADCSGSMSVNGKMDALNASIRAALPEMRRVAENNPSVEVQVRTLAFSHGAKWVNEPTSLDSFEWIDLIADPMASATASADVVFLMDTSGSMGGEIKAIRQNCIAFADQITKRGADVRLGLVGFDIGGHRGEKPRGSYEIHNLSEYTIGTWPLKSPAQFKSYIQELKLGQFGGCGCYLADRSTVEIFPHVIKLFAEDRHESRRFLVIITDEIGSTDGVFEIARLLQDSGIVAHVLGVPGSNRAHEQIAAKTGGQFWNILSSKGDQDFSSLLTTVGDTIGKEVKKVLADGSTSAGTDIGAALSMAASDLQMQKMPSRALPPVLVLVSDGRPTDDFLGGVKKLEQQPWGKKAVRLAIGIGADVDMRVLERFIGTPEIKPLTASNPDTLARYIRWVSTAVLGSVSAPSSQIEGHSGGLHVSLPPPPQLIADKFEADQVW